MRGKLAIAVVAIVFAAALTGTRAYALAPASSTNFKINYAAAPAGAASLASASFRARGAKVGQFGHFLPTSLPVAVSAFEVE